MQSTFNFGSGEGVFFTSDTHFNHFNIIQFCKRPFESAKDMDEALIQNWNNVISDNDIVFHLGDFAFGGSSIWKDVLSRLKGKIYLILGNHDRRNLREGYMNRFELVTPQMQIQIGGHSVYLNHYPFLCFGGAWKGAASTWQLFGHVHSGPLSTGLDSERLSVLFPTQYDVGVDNNNFTPISYEQVNQIILAQQAKSNIK